jgi:putative membrane protein
MKSVRIAGYELKQLWGHRRVRLATAVITLVPLLYGALYLWAFWDPYARLDQLPVALVNEDRPVTHDGKRVAAGNDLIDKLLQSDTVGWRQVSATEAASGVKDGTYYMALTVPADFSANLATADTTDPTPARLSVVAHESSNLLASQIGERVFSEVRSAAAASASESYLDTIFIGFSDMHGQLLDASLGATDLAEGLRTAQAGASDLAAGASTASDGSRALATGVAAVSSGAARLDTGAGDLVEGAQRLERGLQNARDGAAELAAGTQQADSAAERVRDGASNLAAGIAQAAPQLSAAASGATSVRDGSAAVVAALQAYLGSNPDAASDSAFATALGAAQQTSAGATQLASGLHTATTQLPALAQGADDLASGAAQLADGVASLATGAGALSSGIASAYDGSTALASGANALKSGTNELASGASEAASGARSLSDGLDTLDSGAHSLATGLRPAVAGSDELAAGLTAGVGALPAYDDTARSAHASMMADPVTLTTERLDPVPNYGTGFSPYFIPLALWVGALMVFFIVRPIPGTAVRDGQSPVFVALGGFWSAAIIAVAQSVVMLLVLRFGLGLNPVSTPALYGITILSAVVFIAVLQWLSSAFGPAGKIISIVLLMLQLTSAAGTFPLELTPGFFRAINPYLPMTYVVDGLRQAISGGDWSLLGHDALVLAAFGVAALALTSITAWRARGWDPERLEPALAL